MMGDDLAAQLAEWGEGFEEELSRAVAEEDDSLKRSLCLLAAVEAVLKLTEPDGEVHRDLDGNEEDGAIRVVRCAALREAITAALTEGEVA
jgi:hypothetical protein